MSSTAWNIRHLGFLGLLIDDVSAGQCPVVVWTEGVFDFNLIVVLLQAALIGRPVWPSATGGGSRVTTLAAGCTGLIQLVQLLVWLVVQV